MKHSKYFLLAFLVILIDQVVKILVHLYMDMDSFGEIKILGDWLKLHYTLNPGMAFGIELGSEYGKLGLTLFRLVAMVGISYYLYNSSVKGAPSGFLWCISLVLGGAIGNVIDSTFYGVFLDNNAAAYAGSTPPPFYPWFHGRVVDMFYVDIWEGYLPDNIPLIGGQFMSFWPIFNVADSAIFVGVFTILFMQKKFFPELANDTPSQTSNSTTHSTAEN